MKFCLLLILFLPFGAAAQDSSKPASHAQDAEQKRADQRAKRLKEAEEQAKSVQALIDSVSQEVARQPDSALAHFHLAEALRNDPRQHDEAPKMAEEYRKAIQLKPDYAEAYAGLAVAYGMMNQYDKVPECLNKAIRLKPNYADAYVLLGAFYVNGDKYAEGRKIPVTKEDAGHAVEALKKALAIRPDDGEAYAYLGLAYAGLEKWNEAADALKQSLLFNPHSIMVCYALCEVDIELGNKEAAMQAYNRLKEISDHLIKEGGDDPSDNDIFNSLANDLIRKIQERFGNN